MINFTHLHTHTEYSLLDGSAKITELISHAKNLGMTSLSITDHGTMYGVVDFYKEAKKQGIKPIIGCEVYVSDSYESRENYHLVLLAKDITGYHNIIKLVSHGFTKGFYYKPRVNIDILKKYNQGIIALSGCLSGVIAKPLDIQGYEKAKEKAILYKKIYGSDFYIELQNHGLTKQKEINPYLIQIAHECDLELVATNDVHYTYKNDSTAHDVLVCIQTGKSVHDNDRLRYEGDQFYLKSPSEMKELFSHIPEALKNTTLISEQCNLELNFNEYKLPKFRLKNIDPSQYLITLCMESLQKKYSYITSNLIDRLDYEIETIVKMGFVDYFLITWDFIKYAKDNDIRVGPGRGSAAGSLVSYLLNITTVDPIKYGLLFERFLNPERISMPDIDIDFCYERRGEVIDYCIKKYGKDNVAQIITFGTMAARGVIRDVGRVLELPYAKVDSIAKLIPRELSITLERAISISPELKKFYETDQEIKTLIDMAKRLEGLPRHTSTHAAGVIITELPISDYVPLNQNDGVITTGYTMGALEDLGLLKMDFLGLRTLTVIKNCVEEIDRNKGIQIDIDNLDYTDQNVYKLISSGKTDGLFQLESMGMKSFMKDLKPDCLEDIIAGISLYRPGPMEFIPKYVAGKHFGKINYTHSKLIPILEETYGCIVYQEQVIRIVCDLAGYSLGRADLLRRAMGKKKIDVMDAERQNFIYGIPGDVPGCVAKGIDEITASKIFDEMQDFAKYAFNKSHAAAYAIIGFQTAFLKTYYPIEFMAALMSSIIENKDKVADYIDSSKKMGINILPPDINNSFINFSVENENIRFGLVAIKNVGKNLARLIISEREKRKYDSLTDFITRNDEINKRALESLLSAGTFDSLRGTRKQYLSIFSSIFDSVVSSKKVNIQGQIGIFEVASTSEKDLDNLPNIPDFELFEKLAMEKEILGVYVSGHPLSKYENIFQTRANSTTKNIIKDSQNVKIGGMIINKKVHTTKSGQPMSFLEIEDMFGTIEVIVFSDVHKKYSSIISIGKIVIISGKSNVKEEESAKVIANEITIIEEKKELWVKLSKGTSFDINDVIKICENYNGDTPVVVYDETTKKKYNLKIFINLDSQLFENLKQIFGEEAVAIK